MIVDGSGLIGRAFAALADDGPDALIFARGVADSSCADPAEYAREMSMLDAALEQAADARRPLVYFTGAPIYGDASGPLDEATPLRPVSFYGIHQAAAEERIRAHRASHLIVRLPNVVGQGGNPRQLVPSLRQQIIAGSVVIQEDAERDVIAVEDVVAAVRTLLATGITDRTVVVASGVSTRVMRLAGWLAADLGMEPRFEVRPGGAAQRFRIDLLRSLAPDATRFGADYARRVIASYSMAASERSGITGR